MSFSLRTELLIGSEGVAKLKAASVLVFGAGGVGSYAIEAIVRAGVGAITVVDGDKIEESNINRQLFALRSTVGEYKALAAVARIKDINPECNAQGIALMMSDKNLADFAPEKYSYVVDAIDTVSAKIALAVYCSQLKIPLISSMGTGNKIRENFVFSDIYDTDICPLAKVMRRELRKRGVPALQIVYGRTEPKPPLTPDGRKPLTASISYTPAKAGLLIAEMVILKLIINTNQP